MKKLTKSWQHNISTGTYIKNISRNGRIIRQNFESGEPLYIAEFWGDYSMSFPIRGSWVNTEKQAVKQFNLLKKSE